MRVLGLAGWSGSGKTTLLTALLPLLRARGLHISTVKHAHHGFDLDHPGKDSHRHREAGAHEVLLVGDARWALLHEGTAPLTELLARLDPVDLVLVEGFRAEPHPKIEVFRAALGRPKLWPDRPDIVAVAAEPPEPECGGRSVLSLSDPADVAAWVVRWMAGGTPA